MLINGYFSNMSKCQSTIKVRKYCVPFNATWTVWQVWKITYFLYEMLDTFRYFDTFDLFNIIRLFLIMSMCESSERYSSFYLNFLRKFDTLLCLKNKRFFGWNVGYLLLLWHINLFLDKIIISHLWYIHLLFNIVMVFLIMSMCQSSERYWTL